MEGYTIKKYGNKIDDIEINNIAYWNFDFKSNTICVRHRNMNQYINDKKHIISIFRKILGKNEDSESEFRFKIEQENFENDPNRLIELELRRLQDKETFIPCQVKYGGGNSNCVVTYCFKQWNIIRDHRKLVASWNK